MNRGLFIAFEGIDGCGKSTQLALAAQAVRNAGRTVVITREPGGTPIAEKVRSILIAPENIEMRDECELLLYLAARAQHVREIIEPAMARGDIVLCDRFQLATFAYQGFGRGMALDRLAELNGFATGGVAPDCTLVFDISVDESAGRMKAMNKNPDRLEQSGREFYERIREGYQFFARQDPVHNVLIDAHGPVAQIAKSVMDHIRRVMGQ